ncbi:his operon leader peptide [Pluralibacter gergoviae]|uniref:his operon leader peptide n=1 Tax=Pluralibacter gergoviae TaxID=61647 RepID=A0AAI9DNP1_PLUGE|nr:his operon leader peptide [Pluralibacter gergoviae]AVR06080.1 his operon leader peptide [Pluralibacter gergoviae]EKT9642674.1 his operon leader peptide [Pluralibacter gergoviae]EKV0917260.1 his operon leader peptide [Pluralibacter gergoviae]EKV0930998.1 his operon leader peptide [Pluralibacter gergoviae]EKV3542710.1 his operon leader peptide [Pluralibacter gergoviae]
MISVQFKQHHHHHHPD